VPVSVPVYNGTKVFAPAAYKRLKRYTEEVSKYDAIAVYYTANVYYGRVNLNVKAVVVLAAAVSVAMVALEHDGSSVPEMTNNLVRVSGCSNVEEAPSRPLSEEGKELF
jgi:hypothetical protein